MTSLRVDLCSIQPAAAPSSSTPAPRVQTQLPQPMVRVVAIALLLSEMMAEAPNHGNGIFIWQRHRAFLLCSYTQNVLV